FRGTSGPAPWVLPFASAVIISILIIWSSPYWLAFWRSKPDGPDASVAAPEGLRQSRAAKTGTQNTMDIGFIGLGNMGAPMARRLIEAGHTLIIYDTRNDAVAPLVALGAK